MEKSKHSKANLKSLYKLSGVAAFLQLTFTIAGIIVILTLGLRPKSAEEFFLIMQHHKFLGLLQDDFSFVIVILLYLLTFSGLYSALKRNNYALVVIATVSTFVAVSLSISSHSGFSMLYLSEQYWSTSSDIVKSQIMAAGQAIIAQDVWHGTSAFISGILLQGSGVLISIVMLGNKNFSKVTIFSGIFANGLDLVQHLFHYIEPSLAEPIGMIAGPIYLLWFPMLGRDLYKLGSRDKHSISTM